MASQNECRKRHNRQKRVREPTHQELKRGMKNLSLEELVYCTPSIVTKSLDDGIIYFQNLIIELQRRKEEEFKQSEKNKKSPFIEITFDELEDGEVEMIVERLREPGNNLSLEWVKIISSETAIVRYDSVKNHLSDRYFLSPGEKFEESDDEKGYHWDRNDIPDHQDDSQEQRRQKEMNREKLTAVEKWRKEKREWVKKERVNYLLSFCESK